MNIYRAFICLFSFLCINNVIGTESAKTVEIQENQASSKTVLLMKRVEMKGNEPHEVSITNLAGNLSWSASPMEDGFCMFTNTDMASLRSDFWNSLLTLTLPADYKIAKLMNGPQHVFALDNEDSFVVWGDLTLKPQNRDVITIIHYRVVKKLDMMNQLLDWLFNGFLSERSRKGIPNFLKDHFGIEDVKPEFARRRKEKGKNPEPDHVWSPSDADRKSYTTMTTDGYVDVKHMEETINGQKLAFNLLATQKLKFNTCSNFEVNCIPAFKSLVSVKIRVTNEAYEIKSHQVESLVKFLATNPFLTNLDIQSHWYNIPVCLLSTLNRLTNLTRISIDGISGLIPEHSSLVNGLFDCILTLRSAYISGKNSVFDIKRHANAPYGDPIVSNPLYFPPQERRKVWDIMMSKFSIIINWLNNFPETMRNAGKYIYYEAETMTVDWGNIVHIWGNYSQLMDLWGKALNTKITWITQVRVTGVSNAKQNNIFQYFPNFTRRNIAKHI